MIADDLDYAAIAQLGGLVVAAGYDGGTCYVEISNDGGATQATFADGGTRKAIAPMAEEQPSVEITTAGEIVVALMYAGAVRSYVSRDWGEHWMGLDVA